MEDTRRELKLVDEELALIEDQLQVLLERQAELSDKQKRLHAMLKEAQRVPSAAQKKDWEHTEFEWSKQLHQAKESVFKVNSFRPLQLSTMNATLSGHDCLLIMPTGGGKSLCFQLPAVISKGITLVVSPLVSLMEDQLMALHDLGVKATLLNASSTREEVNSVQAAMTDKNSDLKLLYVTPEKLAKSKRFMNKLEKMHEMGRFSRLVIDEVHCCSQWGHDFRPDYKFLGVMRRQFPGVPILGLTATATSTVISDIKKILNISDCLIFKASFNRTNLFYEVRKKPSTLDSTLDDMQGLITNRFRNQSGIVYCFSRKDSEDITRSLQTRGVKAGCYHADIDAKYRSRVHRMWTQNDIQVVVATVAFGMGIDKPDVRFVLHHSMSKSMENYYQESGRAGRDDQPAHCILYASFSDVFRQSTMVFTEQTGLEKLYTMVAYAYDVSKCRRSLIARHFGENWDSNHCNKMCDHCQKPHMVQKQNQASSCRDVIRLIEHAQATKQRVTALKVLDAWTGKGPTSLRLSSVKAPRMSRQECEQILAFMLLRGYLREDFHFTPYSTISYLLPGSRSSLLKSSDHEVLIPTAKGCNTPAATSRDTKHPKKKLNPAKSKTENKLATAKANPPSVKSPDAGNKKRKRIVVLSESEDSDFESCDTNGSTLKESDSSASIVKKPKVDIAEGGDEDCIFIDDT